MKWLKRLCKKKGVYSKFIVLLIVVLNILFTIKVLNVFENTSVEPSTLITMWFSFTGVELVALAGIKVAKNKNKGENENGQD